MIQYEPFRAFGWRGVKATARDGDVFSVSMAGPRDHATVWTKGRVVTPVGDRVPGSCPRTTVPLPLGDHDMPVVGDSEWWCVSAGMNDHRLPELTPLRVAAGATATLPAGTQALVASGLLDVAAVGTSLRVGESPATVTAVEDSWLILFH